MKKHVRAARAFSMMWRESWVEAKCNKLVSASFMAWGSAFFDKRRSKISTSPSWAAKWRGVFPPSVFKFTSAPAERIFSTMDLLCVRTASCKGDEEREAAFTLALWERRKSTMWSFWLLTAIRRGVTPCRSEVKQRGNERGRKGKPSNLQCWHPLRRQSPSSLRPSPVMSETGIVEMVGRSLQPNSKAQKLAELLGSLFSMRKNKKWKQRNIKGGW